MTFFRCNEHQWISWEVKIGQQFEQLEYVKIDFGLRLISGRDLRFGFPHLFNLAVQSVGKVLTQGQITIFIRGPHLTLICVSRSKVKSQKFKFKANKLASTGHMLPSTVVLTNALYLDGLNNYFSQHVGFAECW